MKSDIVSPGFCRNIGHYCCYWMTYIAGDVSGLLVSVGYLHARQCNCAGWPVFWDSAHRLADSSLQDDDSNRR